MTKNSQPNDFKALVAQKTRIEGRQLLKADLYRLRQVVGPQLKAGVTSAGDFVLYSADASTWQRLVKILPFLTDFREQRIDPLLTKIELLEVVDEDSHLLT